MGWLIILGFIGLICIIIWQSAKKRKAMLDAMSPEERRRFLENEETARVALIRKREKEARLRRVKEDEKRSAGVKQQIAVAKAEGRKHTRVWVPEGHVESVTRWAELQNFTVLKVKDGNRTNDVQLSISNI